MDDKAFVETVRSAADAIEKLEPESIAPHVERVRGALSARGLSANCHVGGGPLSGMQAAEWYAGQLLAISDERAWFAMNSWLNCVDKFCPATLGGAA